MLQYKGINLSSFRETELGTVVRFRGPTVGNQTPYSEVAVGNGEWPGDELWFWEGTLEDVYHGMLDNFKESLG